MKKLASLMGVGLVCVFLAGCATARPHGYLSNYAEMKPQLGFDQVYVAPSAKFGRYRTLLIEVTDKTKPTESLGLAQTRLLVEQFRNELEGRILQTGVFQKVGGEGTEGAAAKLRIYVTSLNPGSHALRFLVGFGAGSARIEAEGEATDLATGESLFRFADARSGGDASGIFGSEELMKDDLQAMAKNIASAIFEKR